MKPHTFTPTGIYSEEYVVTFWQKNLEGFYQQKKESVYFASRNRHKEAEQVISKTYDINPTFMISVIYQ